MSMNTPPSGYSEDILVASGAQTVSGQTGVLQSYGGYSVLRMQINVTAVSGTTPSMTLFVEDTLDGTNWNIVDTSAAITATGVVVRNITTPFADRIRIRWAITGTTPSLTFEVRAACQSPGA